MERPEEAHSPEDAPAHQPRARVCSTRLLRTACAPSPRTVLTHRACAIVDCSKSGTQSVTSLPTHNFSTTAEHRITAVSLTVREHGSQLLAKVSLNTCGDSSRVGENHGLICAICSCSNTHSANFEKFCTLYEMLTHDGLIRINSCACEHRAKLIFPVRLNQLALVLNHWNWNFIFACFDCCDLRAFLVGNYSSSKCDNTKFHNDM